MYQNTAKFYGFFYNGAADAELRSQFVASHLESHPARIVDLSAGVGDVAFLLAEKGCYVSCFEPCDAMYAVLLDRYGARKHLRHLLSLFPRSLEAFPVQLEADIAVAFNLFSHLKFEEKQSRVREVHTQLRPGGKFLFNCVQQTPLRPRQPFTEIGKKVFGEMVIRHFASSTPVEDGARQQVRFEYRMEFRGELVETISDDLTLHMDDPAEITGALRAAGFQDIQVLGNYERVAYHSDLPGFVVVAAKAS